MEAGDDVVAMQVVAWRRLGGLGDKDGGRAWVGRRVRGEDKEERSRGVREEWGGAG